MRTLVILGILLGCLPIFSRAHVTSQCPAIAGISNGYANHQGPHFVGSVVTFHCNPGYVTTGTQSSTCTPNGTLARWNPDVNNNPPLCTLPQSSTLPEWLQILLAVVGCALVLLLCAVLVSIITWCCSCDCCTCTVMCCKCCPPQGDGATQVHPVNISTQTGSSRQKRNSPTPYEDQQDMANGHVPALTQTDKIPALVPVTSRDGYVSKPPPRWLPHARPT